MMVQATSKQAAAASSHSGKCRPSRMTTTTTTTTTTTMVELVLLLTLMIITSSPCSRAADANSDADALRRFQATADPDGAALNWTRDGNPCSIPQTAAWRGVTCQRGRVYKLSITGLNLTGPVTELAALDQLRVLWAGGNAFTGELPPDLARSWRHLRQLFLDGNRLQGGVPESVGNLTSLWRLNLGRNALTGGVPASLGGIARLLTLDLSDNALTGGVPPELARLANLTTLDLSGNRLTGPVPLDLARRFAPAGAFAANAGLCLDDTVAAAVGGLQDLLLPACPPSADNSNNNSTSGAGGRLSTGAIIGIVLADILVVALLTLVFLFFYWRRYSKQHGRDGGDGVSVGDHGKMLQQGGKGGGHGVSKKKRGLGLGRSKGKGDSAGMSSGAGDQSSSQYSLQLPESERSKLVFFHHHHQHDGDRDRDDGDDDGDDAAATPTFDLEDLLRASAEMLGKGSFGTSYKAVLEDGTVVAVKRLKDLSSSSSSSSSPSMSRKEFEAHMEVVGRLRHPNLLPLLAYYYAKDEKLLVYPYQSNGSLYALLHGSRGPGRTPLDWPARLRIARGAAAGLAYLHHRAGPKLPHANIKSSNILLDLHYDACVADFGVAALAPPALVATRAVGYRPPEHGGGSGLGGDKRSSSSSSAAAALALTSSSAQHRLSHRADVYSFGVLLLELLTGKAPAQSHLQDDGIDLPRWVQSVVREEWTAEVFDIELMRYKNIEEEMVALLQVAMLCVSHAPHQRPKMSQVLAMIDDIRPAAATAIASSADRSQSPAAQGSVSSSHSLSSPAPSDS